MRRGCSARGRSRRLSWCWVANSIMACRFQAFDRRCHGKKCQAKNVDDLETCYGLVSSIGGIGYKSPKERRDITSSWPVSDIVCGCTISLVEELLHIIHQIRAHSIVCTSFIAFICENVGTGPPSSSILFDSMEITYPCFPSWILGEKEQFLTTVLLDAKPSER